MNFARDWNFSRIYIFKSAESGLLARLHSSDYKKKLIFINIWWFVPMEIIVIQKIKTGQRQKEYLYLSCSLLQHLFQPYSLYLMQKLPGLWILIFLQVIQSFTVWVNLRPIKKTVTPGFLQFVGYKAWII